MAMSVQERLLDMNEMRLRASNFVLEYKGDFSERSEKQTFWNDFFNIFGVNRRRVATYEKAVKKLDSTNGSIDLFWPGKLIVEHKSLGKNLDSAFMQAVEYTFGIKDSELPRYIIVSDFRKFRIENLDTEESFEFELKDLVKNLEKFMFLLGGEDIKLEEQDPVSIKAAEEMAKLHDTLKDIGYSGHDLEVFLVRLVFCMFADSTGIFKKKGLFKDYVHGTSVDGTELAPALQMLFEVLDTHPDKRMKNLSAKLSEFEYIDGDLFNEPLRIASFDSKMRKQLLNCCALDWGAVSPAVFGSLFQGVMDNIERRKLGAHYTSEENIMKLIRPLFLDELRSEFAKAKNNERKLRELWKKLENIKILDPACGCGNFLIIAYRELRLLEMDIMSAIYGNQTTLEFASKIDVNQFYGIEIKDFPSEIARVAMWLMDHQMNLKMRDTFGIYKPRIPLRASAVIANRNALDMDWREMVSPEELTYIIGNPPYGGAKQRTEGDEQSNDMKRVFTKDYGILDYVSAWYAKAADFMADNKKIRSAFVSTNSVTQGEQVAPLWKPLFEKGLKINFAYSTFKWGNEARGPAAVHVVIVGFSFLTVPCRLYGHSNGLTGDVISYDVSRLNAYLVSGPDVFLENLSRPICDVPAMGIGNKPIDDGNYLFTEEEKREFLKIEPRAEDYMIHWVGSREFINGHHKYSGTTMVYDGLPEELIDRHTMHCLWLGDCPPHELRNMPECLKRVEAVKKFRSESRSAPTRKLAETPTRFHVENMPKGKYLAIPETSSENRKYIPIGFLDDSTLCSNSMKIVHTSSLYVFGILTSSMHMAWMKYVCGRLKSDFRYSVGIVYNNFPWPKIDEKQKKAIEHAAEEILAVRSRDPKNTLADLYDPNAPLKELVKAHEHLNRLVERAYRKEKFDSEAERAGFLFEEYQKIKQDRVSRSAL